VQRHALLPDWPCAMVDYGTADSIIEMAANALAEYTGPLIPVGLSMGGMVALEIWRQAPDRVTAMALFDTDCGADTNERRQNRDRQILMAVHGDFREMVETQLLPSYFSADNINKANAHQALRETVIAMALDLGVAVFAAQITALATRKDSWPLLETIGVPALIACGAEDRICTPDSHRKMASNIQMATRAYIDDAGHLPPLEQPIHTTLVLQSWLEALSY
jgi:pimeloyl-ACP methyl ester carboxylesterase